MNGPPRRAKTAILHLGKYYPPEPGGIEHVVKSLVDATGAWIDHYCLAAARRGRSRIEAVDGGTVHLLREWGTILLAPLVPTLPVVLHRLRRSGAFHVLLLHYPNPTAVAALFISLLARPKRERIAVWYHADVLFEERWKRALYRLYRPLDEFIFRRTDAFVAATPHHVETSATLHRFRDRTVIIPFAVPDRWFEQGPGDAEAARKAREKVGGKYLLFVGRLVPYKGLVTLVEAAQAIGSRIVLIGTGPLEEYIRRETAARGLGGKLILLGRVDDLRPWYLGCEFLVLPSNSRLEAFGIVQIEAMALGKPVVSSDLPTGVTYVNRNGETGLTFPVGDAAAFAAACNRLLKEHDLRASLGERARRRAKEEFSYSAMAGKATAFFAALRGDERDAPAAADGR